MKYKRMAAGFLAVTMTMGMLAGCSSESGNTTGTGTTGSGVSNTAGDEVIVYAAKSMTDCMDELIADYNEINPDVEISANYASSGDLQSQIENGAPCDIFLSAAQTQMDTLEEENLIDTDSRSDLLTNEAVLVTPADDDTITSFDDLAENTVKTVAIGDPESVPAGQYAKDILTTLGIWDTVSAKAVLGADVRQVLAWCETGEADAGIVYATDAAVTDAVRVVCTAPEDSCDPVVYPIALTIDGAENDAAVDFLTFLQSADAAAVLEAYGFGVKQ